MGGLVPRDYNRGNGGGQTYTPPPNQGGNESGQSEARPGRTEGGPRNSATPVAADRSAGHRIAAGIPALVLLRLLVLLRAAVVAAARPATVAAVG